MAGNEIIRVDNVDTFWKFCYRCGIMRYFRLKGKGCYQCMSCQEIKGF